MFPALINKIFTGKQYLIKIVKTKFWVKLKNSKNKVIGKAHM